MSKRTPAPLAPPQRADVMVEGGKLIDRLARCEQELDEIRVTLANWIERVADVDEQLAALDTLRRMLTIKKE